MSGLEKIVFPLPKDERLDIIKVRNPQKERQMATLPAVQAAHCTHWV